MINTTKQNQRPKNLIEGIKIYAIPYFKNNPSELIISIFALLGIFGFLFFLL